MKKRSIVLLLLILIVIGSGCILPASQPSNATNESLNLVKRQLSDNVYVSVDPRVELVEIIYRISGSEWYKERVAPEKAGVSPENYEYLKDIDEYFGKYKGLRAVEMAGKLSERGLTYDALPKFAVHLNPDTFELEGNWSDMLKDRPWLDEEELNEFAEAVREFAEETDFWKFYNENVEFYNATINEFVRENLDLAKIPKFEEEFFGEKATSWNIILQMGLAHHSFGGWLEGKEEKEIYSFLGICRFEENLPEFCGASVHEFAHSFVNPAVDRNYELFEPYESLYAPVKEKMSKMAYGNFKTMLYETLVRAFEAYYLRETIGEVAARESLLADKVRGFYFIEDVYNAYVNEYVPNRDRYRTFDDFMPRLAEIIGEVYKRTNGGKNVELPEWPTVNDFAERLSEKGCLVVYHGGNTTRHLAERIGERFRLRMEEEADINDNDLKNNIILVLLPDSELLKRLENHMVIRVNGTSVYSNVTGKTYTGSIRAFEVIKNPWDESKLMLVIVGTEDSALRGIHAYNNLHYSIRDARTDKLLEGG
ncbi:hypothetical protein OCC_09139 [Thermococcus litoralis DSM 5473]|jgi:NTP pyrophosphatase (non-canonical NTP hydrolase)|uniref:DUF4932 domain-containing protein n=1 Tax=Thermococcus litoralis (strain ATCC 51850 / DSM 5473 / JCM 8560 / NS-C) TaxID=523849 RepID=H3ZKE6_THELN|nr:DUF4932 domain-containing protein [Thermococcus litoralis]EHR79548.1 hypothetical protein OCC_09139 [Thermococcus litoralis DSM 5473]